MPAALPIDNAQTFQQHFGAWLRQARRRAGWSQPELARRAQVSQAFISTAELGRTVPTLLGFCVLCNALNENAPLALGAVLQAHRDNLPLFRAV